MDRNANYCKKRLEAMRRSQEKLEKSFPQTKGELSAMKSRMDNAEERISDLEDRIMEITQLEQWRESQMKKKNESNVTDLQDKIKHADPQVGIPEEAEREKGIENVFEEIIAENCPNLKKEADISQVQEVHRVPNKMNPNRPIARHN